MSLVEVINLGIIPQELEENDTSPAEDELLLNPHLPVGVVEHIRDDPHLGRVQGDIRVQKVEGNLPNLNHPGLHVDQLPLEGNLYVDGVAVFVFKLSDGLSVPLVLPVVLFLVAVEVDPLVEVTVLVEKTHSHEGDPDVRGRLQVVSREDPQASGVDGNRFVEPILHGKVGDRILRAERDLSYLRRIPGPGFPEGFGRGKGHTVPVDIGSLEVHIFGVLVPNLLQLEREALVLGQPFEFIGLDLLKHLRQVVVALAVKQGVDPAEESLSVFVPVTPKVEGKAGEIFESFRNGRLNKKLFHLHRWLLGSTKPLFQIGQGVEVVKVGLFRRVIGGEVLMNVSVLKVFRAHVVEVV